MEEKKQEQLENQNINQTNTKTKTNNKTNNKKIIYSILIILVILLGICGVFFQKTKLLFMTSGEKFATILTSTGSEKNIKTESTLEIKDAHAENAVPFINEASAKKLNENINKLNLKSVMVQKGDKNNIKLELKAENEELLKVDHYADLNKKNGVLKLYGDDNLTYITDLTKLVQKQDINKLNPYIKIVNEDAKRMSKKYPIVKNASNEINKLFKGSTLSEIKFKANSRQIGKIVIDLTTGIQSNAELKKDLAKSYKKILEKIKANNDYELFDMKQEDLEEGIKLADMQIKEAKDTKISPEQKRQEQAAVDKIPEINIELNVKIDMKNRITEMNLTILSEIANIYSKNKTQYNIKGNVEEISEELAKGRKIEDKKQLEELTKKILPKLQNTQFYKKLLK